MKKGPLSKRIYINEEEVFGVNRDKHQATLHPYLELHRVGSNGHVMVYVVDHESIKKFEIHRSDSIKMENWFASSRRWWAKRF